MPETISLSDIQRLQFSDKKKAEEAIQKLMQVQEGLSVTEVDVKPKPESLNSINGFVTFADGRKYFFKAHTEENEQISEYYNAELLAQSGYPMICAKQVSNKPGQQFVLYEILSFPTLFDLFKAEEDKELASVGSTHSTSNGDALVAGQIRLDKQVFEIYTRTLQQISAEQHAKAPVHQLFQHRLSNEGRLGLYYRNSAVKLKLDGHEIAFSEMAGMRWQINGVDYGQTLNEIIANCRNMLEPQSGPAIIGHGDAHNGNVFVATEESKFYLFDPAFAGLHSPLLDLVKPTFHNVFARWMYYPEQVKNEIKLACRIEGNCVTIDHTFLPSRLRLRFLESRNKNVLTPTIELLSQNGQLLENWREYLRCALFCCAFLTVNLFAQPAKNGTLAERYPIEIKLLALSMAMELGASQRRGSNKLSEIICGLLNEEQK